MDIFYDLVVLGLLEQYSEETTLVLLLAFMGALISWALTEPIMMAIFADEKKVSRWKPIGFFLIDVLFFFLLSFTEFTPYDSLPAFLAAAMFISALSAAIYGVWPQVLNGLGRAANRYSEGSKLDKKPNGDSNKEEVNDN